MNATSKVIWAVDPFSADRELQRKTLEVLKRWRQSSEEKVEPVYVVGSDPLVTPKELLTAIPRGEREARDQLGKVLSEIGEDGLLPPKVLSSPDFSARSAAKKLVDYARETGAKLIAVGSQSRVGPMRFLLGSFAETLVLNSDIPVLFLTPKMSESCTFKRIFFVTDLSESSSAAFSKVLELAERNQAELTVYNKIEYLTEFTLTLSALYERYLDQDLKRRQLSLDAMVTLAQSRGIQATALLDKKLAGASIAESILTAAEEQRANLIAAASQSGWAASLLPGTVVRKVCRASTCPVWVVRSPSVKTSPKHAQVDAQAGVYR